MGEGSPRHHEAEGEEAGGVQATTKLRQNVLSLLHRGHIPKDISRVVSHWVAYDSDPVVTAQLGAKFPLKKRELPRSVNLSVSIDRFHGLRGSLLALPAAVSPGSGGLRNEYLVALGERLEDEEIQLLERFSLAYIRTELPPWFYKVWLTLQTVALFKTAERKDVRPLGLRNSLVKVIHREVMAQSKTEIRDYLEPVQLGQSVAGAAKLVFSVGGALRSDPDLACCRIDLRNAFNECSKTAILEVLASVDSLAHLTSIAATLLTPTVALESGGGEVG